MDVFFYKVRDSLLQNRYVLLQNMDQLLQAHTSIFQFRELLIRLRNRILDQFLDVFRCRSFQNIRPIIFFLHPCTVIPESSGVAPFLPRSANFIGILLLQFLFEIRLTQGLCVVRLAPLLHSATPHPLHDAGRGSQTDQLYRIPARNLPWHP